MYGYRVREHKYELPAHFSNFKLLQYCCVQQIIYINYKHIVTGSFDLNSFLIKLTMLACLGLRVDTKPFSNFVKFHNKENRMNYF